MRGDVCEWRCLGRDGRPAGRLSGLRDAHGDALDCPGLLFFRRSLFFENGVLVGRGDGQASTPYFIQYSVFSLVLTTPDKCEKRNGSRRHVATTRPDSTCGAAFERVSYSRWLVMTSRLRQKNTSETPTHGVMVTRRRSGWGVDFAVSK